MSLNGTIIAGARSCEIEKTVEMVKTIAPISDNGVYEYNVPGRMSWKVNVGCLLTYNSSTTDALSRFFDKVGTSFTLAFIDSTTMQWYTGTAYCTGCRITGTKGNLAQGSFAFEGTGPLSLGTA